MKDLRGWLLIGAVYERPKRLVTYWCCVWKTQEVGYLLVLCMKYPRGWLLLFILLCHLNYYFVINTFMVFLVHSFCEHYFDTFNPIYACNHLYNSCFILFSFYQQVYQQVHNKYIIRGQLHWIQPVRLGLSLKLTQCLLTSYRINLTHCVYFIDLLTWRSRWKWRWRWRLRSRCRCW